MYNTDSGGDSPKYSKSERCKPDYEAMAAKLKKKIDVFISLRNSLIAFVEILGGRSLRQEPSSVPELIGMLVIDVRDMSKEYDSILAQMTEEE